MRQNLTNIKEVNIEDVEHFYVVGSTTKEGLIEGRSNVKLDLKKVCNGEGGSSEDSALVKTMFGLTPYAVVMSGEQSSDPLPVVTLEEALRTAGDDVPINIVYKEKEPKGKYSECGIGSMEFKSGVQFIGPVEPSIMVKQPQGLLQDGPWYSLTFGDVDLTEFPVPEYGGDPVVLTGVEIPNKDEITIFYIGDGGILPSSNTLNKVSDGEFRAGNDILTKGSDDVWLWSRIMALKLRYETEFNKRQRNTA